MKRQTRREILKELGLGAAIVSMGPGDALPDGAPAQAPFGTTREIHGPATAMAIAAHPGDALFTMGAAVARQVSAGGKGIFFNLTHGEKGNPAIAPLKYGAMQVAATEKAAKILGAETLFLSYPDAELPDNEEARFAVCDAIRQYKPAIIITHWKGSMHKDHRACYNIVEDAIFYAGLPGIRRRLPAYSVSTLLFAENWEDAKGFQQDFYLDVSDVFERWVEACAAFPMWRGESGFHYDDYYRSLAVARGALARIGQKDRSRFKYAVALMSTPRWTARPVQSLPTA
ncbi:MAG: PIG-L family deacetylase [Acidobacteriota bacterium]